MQGNPHRAQPSYYNRIMSLFRVQHDITECVTTAINHVLQEAEPEINSLVVSRYGSSQSSIRCRSSNNDNRMPHQTATQPLGWPDILASNPLLYLRLSLSLDSALSHGKAPRVTDLPLWTNGPSLDLSLSSLPMSLFSPSMQFSALQSAEQPRLIEIGEDDNVADTGQCKHLPTDLIQKISRWLIHLCVFQGLQPNSCKTSIWKNRGPLRICRLRLSESGCTQHE